jgi:predicted AAA+ superfamily ATPase
MRRSLSNSILQDLVTKIVLLSGPRQVGKTTLSKGLLSNYQYLNYDDEDSRRTIFDKSWDRSKNLIIFDELHKKPKWKSWIKGIFDTENIPPSLMVTGSARLDVFKKGSDSLAGRHFSYRLHPFTVAELKDQIPPKEALETLMRVGGFPEPFLKNSEDFAKRWRRSHIDRILKEDLLELEQIRQLKALEILIDLLADRVGSPISFNSLARDLEISPHTVKRWIEILEAFYIIFIVPPFSKNLARSILKEPKIYFYDTGKVKNDPGVRFENLVACALLKDLHLGEDIKGENNQLYYLRDKEKREVDFLILRDKKIDSLIEVKLSDDHFSKNLIYYQEKLLPAHCYQVVKDLTMSKSTKNIKMKSGVDFLISLEKE